MQRKELQTRVFELLLNKIYVQAAVFEKKNPQRPGFWSDIFRYDIHFILPVVVYPGVHVDCTLSCFQGQQFLRLAQYDCHI